MKTLELKWEVSKRLEEIERCLWWGGKLRRADLISKFGISPQQASADISLYQKLAPGNAKLNRSARQYEPTSDFSLKLTRNEADEYIAWAGSSADEVTAIPMPLRSKQIPALRPITLALHQQKSLQVEYQSMGSERGSSRRITPHSIISDGYRYHTRAFCHSRKEFRDFVLGRITDANVLGGAGPSKEEDNAWNTLLILRIGPHPGLSISQRTVIERDYGMKKGELHLRVRQAMLHYVLAQLRFDQFTEERTPAEQQIILLNPDILSFQS